MVVDTAPGAAIATVGGTATDRPRVGLWARPGFEPTYQSTGAAGADLRACLDHSVDLAPGERHLVATGVFLAIPDGFEGQVRPRSGLAVREGLTVLNSPGTIDSDYRGEIRVPLINHGSETVTIEPGMRIAQLVIAPAPQAVFVPEATLSETSRGDGGFGSTGRV